ncbi:hypothetical protein GYMLUDRAFT_45934 [Collybiopsis luxurians FD-317 M1]|uniref:Uncharacterized protein n=1 Tax=Collybiopsis luxurians FD-317 M1 TaxID=944289 RepID=A0A0D0BRB6_9AGAR|nr:hypothetical protein GYMLUDRAFT_45934 [Collybiopsis luxurians FD-317 M1]
MEQAESPNILLLYGDSAKELSNEVKSVLSIIQYEHNAAPEQRKREMLDQLDDRLQEFFRLVPHFIETNVFQ